MRAFIGWLGVRQALCLFAVVVLSTMSSPGICAGRRSLDRRLYKAVDAQDLTGVKRLLNEGANVNRSRPPYDPLIVLAVHHFVESRVGSKTSREIVELLLEHGVAPNARDRDNETALSYVASDDRGFDQALAERLVHYGAKLNLRDGGGVSCPALCGAAGFNLDKGANVSHLAAVKWLIGHGAVVNDYPHQGGSLAVVNASVTGDAAVLEYLIGRGAKFAFRGPGGMTPLMLTSDGGFDEAVRCHPQTAHVLMAHGVNANARGPRGRTVMMFLADVDNEDDAVSMAKDLVAHGAKPGLKDRQGHTAAQLAAKNAKMKLADYLSGLVGK